MLQSVTSLVCATPDNQPLSISATRTSTCRNSGRGYATRSGAADGARAILGRNARIGVDFVVLPNEPIPGRWGWQRASGRISQVNPQTRPPASKTSEISAVTGGRVLPKPTHDRRPDGLKIGSRDAVMVDLVLRPQGATRAEMRDVLGWKSDPYPSMIAACDKAGVEVSVLRHGVGPFRYCGRYQIERKAAMCPTKEPNEIEITPEMIKAGVEACEMWSASDLPEWKAIDIYRQMERARLAGRRLTAGQK